MYAVLKTGGKQYRVAPGDILSVEKLDGDKGASVSLDNVLLVSTESGLQVGQPTLEKAKVNVEILAQAKGPKIVVKTYRRRSLSQARKKGHRQELTKVKVSEIVDNEGKSFS